MKRTSVAGGALSGEEEAEAEVEDGGRGPEVADAQIIASFSRGLLLLLLLLASLLPPSSLPSSALPFSRASRSAGFGDVASTACSAAGSRRSARVAGAADASLARHVREPSAA